MDDLDLNPRLRVQIVLAISGDAACPEELHRHERQAQALGLTGAEIDAARRGGSFDRHAAAVVAYACALSHGDPRQVSAARQQALLDGSTAVELALVEQLTVYLLERMRGLQQAS